MDTTKTVWENLGLTETQCQEAQHFVYTLIANGNQKSIAQDILTIMERYGNAVSLPCSKNCMLAYALHRHAQVIGVQSAILPFGFNVILNPNITRDTLQVDVPKPPPMNFRAPRNRQDN